MPVCAIAKNTADGLVLVLDPTQTNPTACTYVVHTGSESMVASLGALSIQDASLIGTGIWIVWAIAWGIRQVGHSLINPNERESNE